MTTTTEQAPPASARPGTPVQRLVASLVMVGLVVTGSTVIAAADLTSTPVLGGHAARYVPADGNAALLRFADGSVQQSESARGTGPAMMLELPAIAGNDQFAQLAGDAALQVQLWRETLTTPGGAAPQTQTLYRLDAAGVGMITTTGGPNGFTFTPAVTVLPADARPGVSWSGEGSALPQGLLGYRSTGSLAAADGGCLLASTTLDYLDGDTGASLLTISEDATWCPGRGIVHTVAMVGDEPVEFTAEPLPVGEASPRELAGEPDTAPASRDWSDAATWAAGELAFTISDPLFGDNPVGTPFDGSGAVTGSGLIALGAGGDVLGYARDGATATRSFIARPGGSIVRITAVGEVLLVATTERRLVAYDTHGVRLWSRGYADLVLAPPVAARPGEVVVVALDGTVSLLDLASGDERWSVELRSDVEAAAAVVAGLVVVADRGQTVHALAVGDGAERWTASADTPSIVAAGGDAVAVVGQTGELTVLEARDGAERWSTSIDGVVRDAVVQDGTLVAMTDEGTFAYALAAETQLWEDVAGDALATDGTRIALLGHDAVAVRAAASGEQVGNVTIGAARIGNIRILLPLADALWVVTTATAGLEVGP